ncbi:MAG: hypothetical protein ACI4UK_01915 [Floccifex sp.]
MRKNIVKILIAGIVLIVGITFLFSVSNNSYEDTLKRARKYYENQNYTMAEDFYLKAIDIDSNELESYEKLYEIYSITNDIKNKEKIMIKAKELLSEDDFLVF